MTAPTPIEELMVKPVQQMSDSEIVALMRGPSVLAEVRRLLYHGLGEIEQSLLQRHRPTIIEQRKLEFIIAQRIIAAVRAGEKS